MERQIYRVKPVDGLATSSWAGVILGAWLLAPRARPPGRRLSGDRRRRRAAALAPCSLGGRPSDRRRLADDDPDERDPGGRRVRAHTAAHVLICLNTGWSDGLSVVSLRCPARQRRSIALDEKRSSWRAPVNGAVSGGAARRTFSGTSRPRPRTEYVFSRTESGDLEGGRRRLVLRLGRKRLRQDLCGQLQLQRYGATVRRLRRLGQLADFPRPELDRAGPPKRLARGRAGRLDKQVVVGAAQLLGFLE